jgi:hypothetical protein
MNGPLPAQNISSRISTTSSRRDEITARKGAQCIASESNTNLDEKQAIMEAIEASEAANFASEAANFAAQAKLNGVRHRNEIEKFEVQALLSENLAQNDDKVNEARVVHGNAMAWMLLVLANGLVKRVLK